ncbi:ubiquitin recognition factor in ER-associated degradation protein 1 isoform X1 [Passer montanus]|uniref:ubiquitin recognition factor in ER-associated degradation protein 1 isoform X1 n=1 Tax=Passer montanus TaxID=9160 RepID=UPI00195F3E1A|nr:ubiquitin recognition factor in ER-associated degradation protein 1 isoform X1 [Passer montanus]
MAASEGASAGLPPSPAMAAQRPAPRGTLGGAGPGTAREAKERSWPGPARPPRERPPPPCSLSICLTTPSPACSRTVFQPSTAASRCPCSPGLMTVIMPPSALDQLSRLNITYPMLFKLTNKNSDRMTHCGVLEFVADEGICYLPHWMMQNLLLEEGGLVQVESVNLQVATYSKFQPQSPDFLDITNPKAVLENALRNFACLTTGDVIAINYNEKIYELRVMETKPDKAVSIIECDMNVDFDAPLGYKEPERSAQHEEAADVEADHSGYVSDVGFRAFSGSGNRLDGKKKGVEPSPSPIKPGDIRRGIPNYDFKIGRITFIRNSRPLVKKVEEDESGSRFIAFSGEGQSLRKKGRKP